METLGVGIIGFGFIGKVHNYGYKNIPLYYNPAPVHTRMVGVATSRMETARRAVEQGGFEYGTDDWTELIEDEDIDIINICSPNSLHGDQLVAAMEAEKHIYCDKPLLVGEEDARRVSEALKNWDKTGQMTLQYRFYPATLRAKQLIEDGFLGEVANFRASYLHASNIDPDKPMGWKQLKSEGGGVLQDLGSHVLDLMDHLIGPFNSVLADKHILFEKRPNKSGDIVPVEAEDHVNLMIRMPNGAPGFIEASKIATGTEDELRFEIHGTKGALRFNLMNPNYLEAYDLREEGEPIGGQRGWRQIATVSRYEEPAGFPGPKFTVGWIRGHMHCLYSFLEALAGGTEPEPSLHRGLRLREMLAAADTSAETESWQSF
ncbi:MAG: Gfo/Idh/MocA family protein [Armatimonadota bacterium]